VNWSIRQAGLADVKTLALIGSATFLETFADVHTGAEIVAHCEAEHSIPAYERLLGPETDVWLAETAVTAAPAGYAVLAQPDLPGHRPGDLELRRIYTLSRLHGTGAGAALMERAVARAQERGAARLLLGVYSGNARAIAFYRKVGFDRIGEHRFFVSQTGYEDWILAREFGSARSETKTASG
jgi:ribosomal protein S18 acetylase RimI-like enzyme